MVLFPFYVYCSVGHLSHLSNGLLVVSCIICGSIILKTRFSQLSLIVSVVAASIFVASVVVVS